MYRLNDASFSIYDGVLLMLAIRGMSYETVTSTHAVRRLIRDKDCGVVNVVTRTTKHLCSCHHPAWRPFFPCTQSQSSADAS
jgi:hypothetical protein